ncbi:MAG: hypothetical protein HC802_13105 [Caldilineaceae bacterium]|nr:hypothetical protein [Caldilineaceae bacterium]
MSLLPSGKGAAALGKAIGLSILTPNYDPVPAFKFYVFVDLGLGLSLNAITEFAGGFSNCDGLEMTRDYEEYREGGLNHYTHKLPGRPSLAT